MGKICLIHILDKWQQLQEKLRINGYTKLWELRITHNNEDIPAIQAWKRGDVINLYMHPDFANQLGNSEEWVNAFTNKVAGMEQLAMMLINTTESTPRFVTA